MRGGSFLGQRGWLPLVTFICCAVSVFLLCMVCMALRGCLRLAGIEDVGCLSRFHVLTCAVKPDWNSGCRLNELMTRFGMCSLSLLGAGRAWLSISAGGEQLSLFSWLSMFFFRLGCRGGCTTLCMVHRCVFLHDWLAFPLHGSFVLQGQAAVFWLISLGWKVCSPSALLLVLA